MNPDRHRYHLGLGGVNRASSDSDGNDYNPSVARGSFQHDCASDFQVLDKSEACAALADLHQLPGQVSVGSPWRYSSLVSWIPRGILVPGLIHMKKFKKSSKLPSPMILESYTL